MMSVFTNEDSYPVSQPPAYAKYVADASSWANVDFFSLFNIGCLVRADYLTQVMIQIFFPTVMIVLAAVAFKVFSKKAAAAKAAAAEAADAEAAKEADAAAEGSEKKAGLCVQFIVVFTFLVFVATSNKVGAASLPSILGCACPDAPTVSCALWFVLPVLASDLLHA